MLAAGQSQVATVSLLIASGCDVHATDAHGCSALHYAALHPLCMTTFLLTNQNPRTATHFTGVVSYLRLVEQRLVVCVVEAMLLNMSSSVTSRIHAII